MDFWTTVIGLLRRKRVLIPAVLFGAVLGATAYMGTPVTYTSQSTMVLTTTQFGGSESQDPATPNELINPMLNFNDSLKTTSAILIEAMNTLDTARALGITGATKMTVNDGRTNPDLLGLNGPFLYVVGDSTSPDEAKRVVVQAQQLMREKLHTWQGALQAPEKTYVSLVDVVPPTAPEPMKGRATKLGMAAAIAGFLLMIGLAYLGQRRRARREAKAAAAAVQVPAPTSLAHGKERRRDRRSPAATIADTHAEEGLGEAVPAPVTIGSRKP
jgi:hypothetical protein